MFNKTKKSEDKEMNGMTLTKDSIIGETLDAHPSLAPLFLEIGMHCLGCPSARGESIGEACAVHGIDCDAFLQKLNAQKD